MELQLQSTGGSGVAANIVFLLPEVSLVESVETMGLETRTTDIASAATSDSNYTLTVDSTDGFEDNGFIRIGTEVIGYTGKTATTSFTGLTRGVAGTTATGSFCG